MHTSIHLAIATSTAMLCASLLPAQTGSFTIYGTGCPGSVGTECISVNLPGTFSGNVGAAANFALPTNSGLNPLVCGVELLCQLNTATTPTSMNVWLYDADAAGKPGKIIATSTMTVTPTLMLNRATFAQPVLFAPNTPFFIVFDNRVGLKLPIMSTGTANVHYFGGPPTWNGPFTSVRWNFNVICCGGGKAPVISNTGTPTIGQSFTIDLSVARPLSQALLGFGAPRTSIDLKIIGAAGCTLYTNPLLVSYLATNNLGTAAMKVDVPNSAGLIGATVDTQYAVADPVNPAGVVFTAGGEVKVGK